MTTTQLMQLVLSIAGMLIAQTGIILTVLIMYINVKIDGKIDPLSKNVDMLIQYMVSHEGKIGDLQGQIKGKSSS